MKRIAIITYHYVRPIKGSLYPGIIGLELNKFRKQLNYIQSKYKILDYDSFLQILKSKKKISSNYCLLTFDDGYKDHVKYVLPELNKRKIKGFFFPPSILFNNKKILNVNKVHFLIEKKIDPKIIKDKILTLIHKKKNI